MAARRRWTIAVLLVSLSTSLLAAMREAARAHPRLDGCARGSWDPVGVWGPEGGRV